MYTICQAAGLGKALLCPAEHAVAWPTCSAGCCDSPVEGRLVVLLTISYNAHVLIAFCLLFFLLPDGLAKKFGLTPEQFGENLRDSYQRHETEQFPAEPLELAKDYVCRSVLGGSLWVYCGCNTSEGIWGHSSKASHCLFACSQFPSPEAVLEGARYMVALQIAREPLVRQVLRQTFQERAKINITPTKKGKKVRKGALTLWVSSGKDLNNIQMLVPPC